MRAIQVFLPWPDYEWSIHHLDSSRSNKQVTEGYQLLKTSVGLSTGHTMHPARTQYHDRVGSLMDYIETCYRVWSARTGNTTHLGYHKARYTYDYWTALLRDEPLPELTEVQKELFGDELLDETGIGPAWVDSIFDNLEAHVGRDRHELPWAVGHPAFHLSHQFNLGRKRGDTYAPIFGFRAWSTMYFKSRDEDLEWKWGDESAPLVDCDFEPYMWPVTVDGEELFQVGTKTDRVHYAELYDEDPKVRAPLLVTPAAALERLERDRPVILANYLDRVAAWAEDRDAEHGLELLHSAALARLQPEWPISA